MQLLDGKKPADAIFRELCAEFALVKPIPKLYAVIIGNDCASLAYAKAKAKKAAQIGIELEILQFCDESEQNAAENAITHVATQQNTGIIIEQPLPPNCELERLLNLIPPHCDIDCQKNENLGKLINGHACVFPATPAAVVEMLKFYDIATQGKNIVVVGRSATVGMPLAVMLSSKGQFGNATVEICHTKTCDLAVHTRRADILIAAAGKPALITANYVKDGAVVLDVGTTVVDGKLVGDVDFAAVSQVAAAISPVPGGVGAMTTAMIFSNFLQLIKAHNPEACDTCTTEHLLSYIRKDGTKQSEVNS